tara:strand:- start:2244 stop:2444 length:201 start_codon:yes stop_codon:yes gene_type:complete
MEKIKKNWEDYISTIMGLIVSIANAWINIDWVVFDINKEYPKLVLSALIVIGGYMTKKIKRGASNK